MVRTANQEEAQIEVTGRPYLLGGLSFYRSCTGPFTGSQKSLSEGTRLVGQVSAYHSKKGAPAGQCIERRRRGVPLLLEQEVAGWCDEHDASQPGLGRNWRLSARKAAAEDV